MSAAGASVWDELSFLVEPGAAVDWRLVVLTDAAASCGLLDRLPATPNGLAADLDLDEHAVRVVLEALAQWRLVEQGERGAYVLGPAAPATPDVIAVLRHHAAAIRNWAGQVEASLRRDDQPRSPHPHGMGIMLAALDVNGRESAPGTVDACLERLPAARTALDLGGGHGQYALELARRGLDVTVQDQPPAVEWAEQRGELAQAGVRLFTGDLFETLPDQRFDLVFCAGVVYTYGPDQVLELYRRARAAIAPGGALAVHTFLRGHLPLAPIFAVQMLGTRRGGDTHSLDEHRRWLAEAGYANVESVRLTRRPESLIMAWP